MNLDPNETIAEVALRSSTFWRRSRRRTVATACDAIESRNHPEA